MAEETAAVLTGEALHAESVTPQMNGVAGGGSERRADGAEATTSTRTETATGEDAPSGSGNAEAVVQEMRQGEQTRTDINSQGVASGVAFAAEFSGGAAVQAGHGEDEARSATYATPRSTRSVPIYGESTRVPAVNWPGWMTRLGDMLRGPPTNWMPSPLPSPPRPRRLLDPRSLRGSVGQYDAAAGLGPVPPRFEGFRGVGPVPTQTTPSSSSIPAEAIQAEVQRQLGGLLNRLQQAEQTNHRLQEELEITRRDRNRLAESQAHTACSPVQERDFAGGVTGDLEHGNNPVGLPEPRGDHFIGQGDGEGIPRRQSGDDVPVTNPRTGAWRDPIGALWDGLQSRISPPTEQDRGSAHPQFFAGLDEDSKPRESGDLTTTAILEALTKNLTSLQELQAKNMKRDADSEDAPEQVKNAVVSLPPLPGPDGVGAGIVFQDWLAQVAIPMRDLSASSAQWWDDVLKLVRDSYSKWLAATPLERLQLEPTGHEALTTSKWTRVNSRACSMILQSLVESIRVDLIARRSVQSSPMILFRLHTCYQPGGASERAAVLNALQSPSVPQSLDEALVWLRSWPRWVQRCKDLNMMVPDGSVLSKALTTSSSKYVGENPDTQFRTQLLRSSLRIDGQPGLQEVVKYQQHLQAELESIASARGAQVQTTSLKAVAVKQVDGTSSSPTSTKPPCKYFVKASGCRRGQKCPYAHDWSSISKQDKSKKCLICGSEDHRQRECPTKIAKGARGHAGPSSPQAATSSTTSTIAPADPKIQSLEPEGEASPTRATAVIPGEPVWTLETLLQAAAKVAGASPSTVSPSLNVMAIRNGPPGSGVEGSFALVDSGATHALRRAMSSDEWEAAKPVVVNLAGGESVCLRINEAGTILIPCSTPESSTSSSPIVPLGALVEQLGYMMCWKGSKCKLVGEDGQVIQLRVREGCPEITECEALRLIAQLEDRRLEELRMNTSRTSQRVKAAALAMDKTWFDHFLSYVDSEFASEAHKAIETAGFLDGVPRQCVAGMFDAIPETNGWKVLPGLKHLNRKYRKRLWRSKSWVVHLFAGERKQPELYHLDNHGQVVLELDIARGRSQNILDPAVWRVLEWAARQGRISAIIGGPPQGSFMISRHIPCGPEPLRSNEFPYGGWSGQSDKDLYEVNRHTTLYVRMIVLHALATAGRIRHHTEPSQHKEVAFMIEQPRDPRGYLKFGDPLYPDVVSFWRTPLWMEYALEAGLYTYSFDMAAFGKAYTRMTTLGTNLPLPHLHGLRMKFEVGAEPADPAPAMVWPQEFREKLVLALRQWLQVPRMLRMSADQWRDHVRRGHLPFRADCAVCVQAGATGRRHSKVEHPSAFVLSADLSGPVKIGGVDPDGRGAFPKQYKYIFAAKLRIPKSFVDDGRGVWAGYEVGELKAEDFDDVDDGLAPADSEPKPYEKERDKDIDVEEEPELKPEARRDHEEDLDLAGPELVNLIFSCGLKDDKATSVLEAVQDVVLYCRSLNIPILRFHSDNGMEFRARATRQWLKGEGIRVTTSEPGVHQTNGTAESTVRWLKQRARTLLLSAGLPQHLWPSALSAATSLQRGEVLGFEPKLAAPYGAKVLVRKRHMEGPKQEDLAPKWVSGHYLGLSDSLSKGHLVYVKDDHGERFIHTLHVRAGLHDPGPVEDTVEAELPRSPERRVRGKAAGSGDVVEVSKARVVDESELQQRAEKLLRDWSQEEAESLVVEVARICPDDERCYGMFRHGGRLGITKATVERPWFARLLSRVLRERSPDAEFAAVFVSANNQREVHIDRNNAVGTVNHLLPLSMPRRGGDLWLELRDGDVVSGKVLELVSQEGRVRYGCAHSLQEGKVFAFDPHRRHAVLPWNGERIVIVGYTPGLLASVSRKDREVLWDLQFPLPLHDDDVEVPEIYINAMSIKAITRPKSIEEENVPIRGGGWKEVVPTSDGDYLFTCDWSISRTSSTTIGERSQAERSPPQGEDQVRQEKWDDWEMRLVLDDVEDGVATASLCQGGARVPYIHKTEVAYTDAAEELLKGLSSPLSVVHTVSPSEASSHLEHWIPAIAKEAQSLEHAVIKVQETAAEVQQDIASGVAQVIPMKLVFSLKPPDSEGQGFYKRKARIVICGNLATHKPDDVYASTAPAEVVRAAIALATYFKWDLGMIDIVAAFLQTPLCAVKGAPRVYGKPPKLLVKAGICKPGELWLLTHAVYGLQESPRLWGAYRDQLLADLCLEIDGKEVVLSQGGVESSWWRVQERTTSKLVGILVVYVDDILLCGATNTVRLLAQAIQRLWKTSPLQFVEEKEIRFLGIEVARVPGGYSLSQKSYINELLRLHKMPDRRRDLVPIAKESATFIAEDNEGPQSEEEIRLAQQVAGELLWISQRTRPDIAFACSLIGSLATRAPRRAVDIGYKVLAFLQRTKDRRLVYEGSIPILGAFVDASFAPDSNRSHTGWLIQLAGNTIAWRSSRQACITLSTAEAELEAATEGLVALQGIQAVLQDIGAGVFRMEMHSDSTSALAIAKGSCSWRTRHLRLKSAWMGELVDRDVVVFNHCSGDVQPADMLTKPLSSGRLRSLSELIGLSGEDHSSNQREDGHSDPRVSSSRTNTLSPIPKVLIALLVLAQAAVGERIREDQAIVVYGSGVSVDYSMLTWMLLWLALLLGLLGWEAVKWAAWKIYDQATPGASARRLRRLQRLRDATADAIQKEVSQRSGSRGEQRALDSTRGPREQRPDPPRDHRREPSQEERAQILMKLARGIKETANTAVQTTAFMPVTGPQTRVILRYVHEPPGEVYTVPGNECFHVYPDCHAFRHRGTLAKVEKRRLCQYCSHRAEDDPDKIARYGEDLARAREYEDLFNTTLTTSGQSSRVS